MFKSAFKLFLSDPVHEGQATIGCFNGSSLSLTCVTNAGKVFVHTPQATNLDGDNQVKYLNVNKQINCIASGTIDPMLRRDVLLIGTPNNLLAYDVEENRDLFFRDVPDGVTSCLVGKVRERERERERERSCALLGIPPPRQRREGIRRTNPGASLISTRQRAHC